MHSTPDGDAVDTLYLNNVELSESNVGLWHASAYGETVPDEIIDKEYIAFTFNDSGDDNYHSVYIIANPKVTLPHNGEDYYLPSSISRPNDFNNIDKLTITNFPPGEFGLFSYGGSPDPDPDPGPDPDTTVSGTGAGETHDGSNVSAALTPPS